MHKYLTQHLNYGKAAKRMYNVFRLSGRHMDAAFVRELFDEPATILYQVWSLISTLENATKPGSSIPIDDVQAQADALVLEVVQALDGDAEAELVESLLQLRQTLESQNSGEARSAEVDAAQTQVVNLINTFYRDRLDVRCRRSRSTSTRCRRSRPGTDRAGQNSVRMVPTTCVVIVDDEHQVPAVEGRAGVRDAEAHQVAGRDVDVTFESQERVLVAERVDASGMLQVEPVVTAHPLERDREAGVEGHVAAARRRGARAPARGTRRRVPTR